MNTEAKPGWRSCERSPKRKEDCPGKRRERSSVRDIEPFQIKADKREVLGDDLLSHTVAHAVPSALESLTSVFGMGTGVSSPLWSPRTFFLDKENVSSLNN